MAGFPRNLPPSTPTPKGGRELPPRKIGMGLVGYLKKSPYLVMIVGNHNYSSPPPPPRRRQEKPPMGPVHNFAKKKEEVLGITHRSLAHGYQGLQKVQRLSQNGWFSLKTAFNGVPGKKKGRAAHLLLSCEDPESKVGHLLGPLKMGHGESKRSIQQSAKMGVSFVEGTGGLGNQKK